MDVCAKLIMVIKFWVGAGEKISGSTNLEGKRSNAVRPEMDTIACEAIN